jgi:hypothetical protein
MRRPFFEKDDQDNKDTQIDFRSQDRYLKFKMLEQEYPIQYNCQTPNSACNPIRSPIQYQDPLNYPFYAPSLPQYIYPNYPVTQTSILILMQILIAQ